MMTDLQMQIPASDPRIFERVIRDPVHNYINVPRALVSVINDPMMQRLRKISQTAMCSRVYPAMTGSRFEHALGAMHLAGEAWKYAWLNSARHHESYESAVLQALQADVRAGHDLDRFTAAWTSDEAKFRKDFPDVIGIAIQTAALLHDIGHPPFSHALESFYSRHLESVGGEDSAVVWQEATQNTPFHETAGLVIVKEVEKRHASGIPWSVVERIMCAIDRRDWAACLHDLVSGEVDIDRLDYLMRDAQRSATEFGAIDAARLVESMELHPEIQAHGPIWRIGFGIRATSALESFLFQRLQYYRWVIFHPHVVAENRMLSIALERMLQLGLEIPTQSVRSSTTNAGDFSWVKSLDYFSVQPSDVNDSDALLERAEVDDGTVVSALKNARAIVTRRRRTRGNGEHFRAEEEFLSLAAAVLHRAPNWAPVWKTEADYTGLAKSLVPELWTALAAQREERIAERRAAERFRRQSMGLYSLIRHLTEALAILNGPMNGDGDYVVALNRLLHNVLRKGSLPSDAMLRESILSHRLSDATAGNERLPSGFWIIAYDDVAAVSADGDLSTSVYNGEARETLAGISATVASLGHIESRRPHSYAYFVSRGGRRMRSGRLSLFGDELREVFLSIFPKAVSEVFGALVVKD